MRDTATVVLALVVGCTALLAPGAAAATDVGPDGPRHRNEVLAFTPRVPEPDERSEEDGLALTGGGPVTAAVAALAAAHALRRRE